MSVEMLGLLRRQAATLYQGALLNVENFKVLVT